MKIINIIGSPRYQGNSTAIARRFCDRAAKRGAVVETVYLNKLSYRAARPVWPVNQTRALHFKGRFDGGTEQRGGCGCDCAGNAGVLRRYFQPDEGDRSRYS